MNYHLSSHSSKYCIGALLLVFLYINVIYYPKWKDPGEKATISYDIAGYYMYLPAAFIYGDLKNFSFRDTLNSPSIDIGTQHGRAHESGGFVFQYTAGMALQYLPFFALGHAFALINDAYPANGFSMPYQFALYFGSLLIAFLGLFYLRKVLRIYFDDGAVTLTLIAIVWGSNYLTYATIKGSLTHNYLFTLYSIILYKLINYYKNPVKKDAWIIGVLSGLAILTRPTEILWIGLFLTWGVVLWSSDALKDRLRFLVQRKMDLISVVAIVLLIGSIQLSYWKYATGNWLVYSYGDQGFSWLNPHVYQCLFSIKAGWLIYSPMMVLVLPGCYFLWKKWTSLFAPIVLFTLAFMYVTFAWDIWWYGGSLGQRALIQIYPVLAFPLAAIFEKVLSSNRWIKAGTAIVFLLFLYLNIWYTHMAHKGNMIFPPQVTKAYLSKVIGTWKKDRNHLKLLDTDHIFEGEPKNVKLLWQNLFDGENQKLVGPGKEWYKSPKIEWGQKAEWIRVAVDAVTHNKEWQWYNQTQLILKLYDHNDKEVKSNMIRLQRHLDQSIESEVFLDVSISTVSFAYAKVFLFNAESQKQIRIKSIRVTSFNN